MRPTNPPQTGAGTSGAVGSTTTPSHQHHTFTGHNQPLGAHNVSAEGRHVAVLPGRTWRFIVPVGFAVGDITVADAHVGSAHTNAMSAGGVQLRCRQARVAVHLMQLALLFGGTTARFLPGRAWWSISRKRQFWQGGVRLRSFPDAQAVHRIQWLCAWKT